MKAIVQRVISCSISVGAETVGRAGPGLVLLVGFEKHDGPDVPLKASRKIANLRVFEDSRGKMNLSLLDTGGTACLVPNFTVPGRTHKGNRPSFDSAMEPARAQEMFNELCQHTQELGVRVIRGVFGAHMHVHLINDGPVSLILEIK